MDILVVNSHGHGAVIYSRLASSGQHHAQLLDDSRRSFALDFKPLVVRSQLALRRHGSCSPPAVLQSVG
jgi:hypothetical protein